MPKLKPRNAPGDERWSARHAGGRPSKGASDSLGVQLGLRLDSALAARLDEIAGRFHDVSRPVIARAALAFGLDVIDSDPALLFFNDRRMSAERVLHKYFWADDETSGTDFDEQAREYVVWILPRGSDGALVAGAERVEARSSSSFFHAIDRLSRLAAPAQRLPWWPRPRPDAVSIGLPRRPR